MTTPALLTARVASSRINTLHTEPRRVQARRFLCDRQTTATLLALLIGPALMVTTAFVLPGSRGDAVPAALRWGSKLITVHAPKPRQESSPAAVTIIIGMRN